MKSNKLLFTILFVLIGCGSLFFGLISCQSVNSAKKHDPKDKSIASLLNGPRSTTASLLIPEVDSNKGVQKALKERALQIRNILDAVMTMNGAVNLLESEALAPIDFVLKRLTGTLLWIYSALAFQRVLLSFSAFLIFIVIIPICALVTIIILWRHKDKTKLYKIAIASAVISVVITFAIPVSVTASTFMCNKILAKKINTLTASIESNGRKAYAIENEILKAKKGSNVNYTSRVKNLSEVVIEAAIDYNIISLFVFVFVPILVLIFIFFLTRYAVRLILL
ncbi:hypothetical protein [Treponema sp. R6D11]